MNSKLVWVKAKKSSGSGGNCVEVATLPNGGRAIRDSKNPDGAMLRVTNRQWKDFLSRLASEYESL